MNTVILKEGYRLLFTTITEIREIREQNLVQKFINNIIIFLKNNSHVTNTHTCVYVYITEVVCLSIFITSAKTFASWFVSHPKKGLSWF